MRKSSRLPSFLHNAKHLSEDRNGGQHLGEAFDQRPQVPCRNSEWVRRSVVLDLR